MSAMAQPWVSKRPLLRAIIVDGEPLGRGRVRDLLAQYDDIQVVAECRNAAEALEMIGTAAPDVIFANAAPQPATRIAIRTANGVTFLHSEDVSWMEAAGNYVRVHAGKQTHLMRETMSRLETMLDPSRFARIHRSTIVNVDRIVQAIPSFGRSFVIVLKDGTRLKLAAQYRDNLLRLGFDF